MAQRIVSLLPAATETLFALGLGDRVVGVSHECDHPPQARTRPVLTASRIDSNAGSAAIHAQVRSLASSGAGLYSLDTKQLVGLAPDLIVTQDLCEVCAVSLPAVQAAARQVIPPPTVVTLNPRRLFEIIDDIGRIAEAAGALPAGLRLVGSLMERIELVARRARKARGDRPGPRVVCLEWLDPPIPAGNWVPEMVEMAGGRVEPAAADHGGSGAWRILSAFKPEVLVVFPCGFSLEQTRRDLPGLFRRPGWDDMPAVHEGRVFLIDGNAYFNRPGPRIVDSLERLAGCLWPSEFPEFARAWGVERVKAG